METAHKTIGSVAWRYVRDLAAIDPRALAAFRILLGLILAADFLLLLPHLADFFSDQGVYPRAVAVAHQDPASFSLHFASGSPGAQLAIGLVGLLLALAFAAGWHPRLAAAGLWLFLGSAMARNPSIFHSGDSLARTLLFWAAFLPLSSRGERREVVTLASFCLLLQVLLVYFFTAIHKDHPFWHQSYLATYYALNLDDYSTALGRALVQHYSLTRALTAGVYYLERLGPLLFLIPFARPTVRTLLAVAFILFHLGLAATMTLASFPWVCISAWLLFLPSPVWDAVGAGFARWPRPRVPNFLHQLRNRPWRQWTEHARNAFLAACLLAVVWGNLQSVDRNQLRLPGWVRAYAEPLGLVQRWKMFSPAPPTSDGWIVVEGDLENGESVDPWNLREKVSFEKPEDFESTYRDMRWKKFIEKTVVKSRHEDRHDAFGEYFCRQWNRSRRAETPRMKSVTFNLMVETTPPPPGGLAEIRRRYLWTTDCALTSTKRRKRTRTLEDAPKPPLPATDAPAEPEVLELTD